MTGDRNKKLPNDQTNQQCKYNINISKPAALSLNKLYLTLILSTFSYLNYWNS
jgi:hypothetical protein